MKLIKVGIIAFLILGAFLIVKDYGLDLDDKGDQKSFAKTYLGWLWNVGKSTKNVATYAVVEQDWLPENSEENETTNESP